MRNRKLAKKELKKQPLMRLKALFIFMFSFCGLQISQKPKRVFFSPIDLLKSFCIDGIIFLLFFFFNFSTSLKEFIKKIVFTFSSTKEFLTFENLLSTFLQENSFVNFDKNPRVKHFIKMPNLVLNASFFRKKLLTFDFQQKKTGDLIFLRKYN